MNWKPAFCGVCLGFSILCAHHDPHVEQHLRPTFVQYQTIAMATSSAVIGGTIPSTITITWRLMEGETK